MYQVLRSRERREHGAAAVEFGLVAIVLLSFIVAVMQFAIWFWAYQVGSHAAREGARFAAVDPCDIAGIQDRAEDRADSASDGTVTVTVTPPSSPVLVGEEITVDVEFDTYEIATGFLPFSIPAISKGATSRVENVPAGGGC